jgi:phosphoribosylformylglycinamidine cyclo-ligase
LIDYKKSGVDIEAGDNLVSWLQNPPNPQKSDSTFAGSDVPDFRNRVISGIGGFAALFDGKFPSMSNPVFVSCTDGVGTKVKLATYFNDFSTVGQDLVAMCANDLICTGGTPLFFLDYYAVGKLELDKAQEFLTGVRSACEKSHMMLIGGETAEMPGVYQPGDFDCAGFSVGVVDKEKLWHPGLVREGDTVLGVASSGFHSNGFSLIRKVFEGEYDKYREWLLEPTRLYVEAALSLKNKFEIHGMAHMTGGGIENLPRILPENLSARISKWPLPECFLEVQKRAGISDDQMRSTFNCGIGLTVILPAEAADEALKSLNELGYSASKLGIITARKKDAPHVEWA